MIWIALIYLVIGLCVVLWCLKKDEALRMHWRQMDSRTLWTLLACYIIVIIGWPILVVTYRDRPEFTVAERRVVSNHERRRY